mmetsp:Transcript_16750/g.21846  ORF Transcript_16750/g.21846 Transcript_16750/m.21846 type:complete len:257 (+) Transcript_16750:955-1725(+)
MLKTHEFANTLVQSFDLIMVAVKQFQKGSLCTSGPFDPTHGQIFKFMVDTFQIHEQILHPQGASLSNCGELCRLVMSVTQSWHIAVLFGKHFQDGQHLDQLSLDQNESVSNLYQICIVANVTRGGTQVNDRHGCRCLGTKGMDMTHDVMTKFLFFFGCQLKINIKDFGSHLFELFVCNVQPEFLFGSRQGGPELPPGRKFHGRRPYKGHFFTRISLNQRMFVSTLVTERIFWKDGSGFEKLVSVRHDFWFCTIASV